MLRCCKLPAVRRERVGVLFPRGVRPSPACQAGSPNHEKVGRVVKVRRQEPERRAATTGQRFTTSTSTSIITLPLDGHACSQGLSFYRGLTRRHTPPRSPWKRRPSPNPCPKGKPQNLHLSLDFRLHLRGSRYLPLELTRDQRRSHHHCRLARPGVATAPNPLHPSNGTRLRDTLSSALAREPGDG